MKRANCSLLVVDFQSRLMPAIADAEAVLANAGRLIDGAGLLKVPVLYTEQYAKGLGSTVPALPMPGNARILPKMSFDACRATGFFDALVGRESVVVCGCEAHVCVLQSVLGLLAQGRRVYVVRDAIGSRRNDNREAAVARMSRHGAEIVSTEMVLFEWLETAEAPEFKAVSALLK